MNFVGLDAHYHQSSYCMMNSQGQVVKQATVRGGHDQLIVELSKLSGPLAIGYEASCGYGTLHDRLVLMRATPTPLQIQQDNGLIVLGRAAFPPIRAVLHQPVQTLGTGQRSIMP
jgi:hypothetical protein